MTMRAPILGLMLLLASCVSAPAERPAPRGTATPPIPVSPAGLEAVMGRTAAVVTGLFGKPDLDVREGSARKLQFAGAACVLDTYLYPAAGGGEPIVTYIDARLPDGRDMDKASCVAALRAGRR